MSETFWESEAAVAVRPDGETQPAPPEQPTSGEETAAPERVEQPHALTMSTDDFAGLEERILRAVALVKQERQERLAAEERAVQSELALREHKRQMEQMQEELSALRAEREQVKTRVERLLAQLDALEL